MSAAAALILGVILSLILTSGVASFLTGNIPRSYPVLLSDATISVAGRVIPVEQLADRYQPKLLQTTRESMPPNSPILLAMWWEAIDAGTSVALVYHPVWEDEHHPHFILDRLYRAYRAIVYGMPVHDIEYIQINVDRSNGTIQRVRYEGSTAANYSDWFSDHIQFAIDRTGNTYLETATLSNGSSTVMPVQIQGPRLHFGIATWSHQLTILNDNNAEQYKFLVHAPLGYLTDDQYCRYKLARRSQGDFTTKDSVIGSAAKFVMAALVLGVSVAITKSLHKFFSITKMQSSKS